MIPHDTYKGEVAYHWTFVFFQGMLDLANCLFIMDCIVCQQVRTKLISLNSMEHPHICFCQQLRALQQRYCTQSLLGAPACISTRMKWAPNKELAPIHEVKAYVLFIGITTFTNFCSFNCTSCKMPNNELPGSRSKAVPNKEAALINEGCLITREYGTCPSLLNLGCASCSWMIQFKSLQILLRLTCTQHDCLHSK